VFKHCGQVVLQLVLIPLAFVLAMVGPRFIHQRERESTNRTPVATVPPGGR
jgi:hypothetical protein